jgi:CheY-like chemotaxis protein
MRSWADDTWVYVTVSDDGAGREAAAWPIGKPLFDTPDDFQDTALDSVRETISRGGGRVMVESRPKVWTRVTVMVRQERRRTSRSEPTVAGTSGESERPSLCVLVIDDNAALRSVLRRYLERRGHAVTEAADGEEGLRVVQGRAFDRVIVDVQMPIKDGPEFYNGLQAVRPDLQARTIFMTGGFLSSQAETVIDESGCPSVRKPFDLVEMAKTIEA